jgi:CubicO group peptidase (beta-lactamase class C family)
MSAIRKLIAMGIAGFLLLAICEPLPAKAADDQPESKKVDEIFADLAKPGSPGCALAAARDGKLLISADEFQLEEGPKLKMMMKEGSVSGFLLDAGRTRGMLFEKR